MEHDYEIIDRSNGEKLKICHRNNSFWGGSTGF
jgi:hypothetical protein